EDGWTWIEEGEIMTFCGSYCDDFKGGGVQFDGKYGCPGQLCLCLASSPTMTTSDLSGTERCGAPIRAARAGGLAPTPLPALDDAAGDYVPGSLPPIVDAHVHLFPDPLFAAIWSWFERHGWPIRYRLHAREVLDFLFARGVERVVGLLYAHKPGIARALNQFMADLAADEPRLCGLATVLPGEPEAATILDEAFALGLRGVKLHCHVQIGRAHV